MTRIVLHTVTGQDEILQRVAFAHGSDLDRDRTNFHVVKAGIADGAKTDYFGTLDQSDKTLAANTRFNLTGDGDLGQLLNDGELIVLDVTTTGSPASLSGAGVQVNIDRSGDDPENHLEAGPERRTAQGVIEHIRNIQAGSIVSNTVIP